MKRQRAVIESHRRGRHSHFRRDPRGQNGDYANLDALIADATSNLIDEIYQDDPELVVITGRVDGG